MKGQELINVGDFRSAWSRGRDWFKSWFSSPYLERRPLPIGRTEFNEWSKRIIKLAAVEADERSQLFSLQGMILSMGPTDAFREDAYFALALRSAAAKQTAHTLMTELKEEQAKEISEKRMKMELEKQSAEKIAPTNVRAIDGVLEDKTVS